MQTSYNWLKQLVDFDLEPSILAKRLTSVGVAVQSVEPFAKLHHRVTVAEVISAEPHPNGERLTVCRLATGNGEYTVVCGAPNVRAGLKAVHVAPGGELASGQRIEEVQIRGVSSYGMLCSEAELGLSDEADIILELPSNAPTGTPAADYFRDHILSFDITPNRPDCLSTFGIAREIGALVGHPFRIPEIARTHEGEPIDGVVDVRIDDPHGCPRYSVAIIENITVGSSPWWLRQRVIACGMRPVNNIVDITNLVMMETGQPLHAFDLAKLKRKQVVVRASKKGERFTTLDNKTHELPADVVLITDGEQTIALGGVMGGLHSEVDASTRTILLESAYFDPRRTRRTRKTLGIDSEAAMRFEKGTDPNMVPYALDRAAHLMAELAGGTVRRGAIDVYPAPITPKIIALRPARVRRILGVNLETIELSAYLMSISLQVHTAGEVLNVRVPTFRPDITLEIDLIEEIARLYGYERIPAREQGGGRLFDVPDHPAELEDSVHRIFVGRGYSEIMTNSMGVAAEYKLFRPEFEPVAIANRLSEELATLRTSLFADMARAAAHNFNHRNMDWKLYTMGTVFVPEPAKAAPREELHLGMALAGLREPRHWSATPEACDWFDLKGALIDLCAQLRVPEPQFAPKKLPGLAEDVSFEVSVSKTVVGRAGRLGPDASKRWDIKDAVWVADVNLSPLYAIRAPEFGYQALPRFPSVTRDLALVVDESIAAGLVMRAVRDAAGPLLSSLDLFDLYRGKPLPEGKKNLALSLEFQSRERSLQAEEVDDIMRKIVSAVEAKYQATLRA
jgi:phenylalanyl-tRNA synthetase beta chain